MTGLILLNIGIITKVEANEKGNGGSATESQIAAQQAQLESVALKIRTFFLSNSDKLKSVFPEFDIQVLVKKIKTSDIRVVDEDVLIDKNGISRTCLNFPDSSLIECKYTEMKELFDQPAALFVLVFHEYLGLIGAEETSPDNPLVIDGYTISKRIAVYLSKVNNYDLVIENEHNDNSNLKIKKNTIGASNVNQIGNSVQIITPYLDPGTNNPGDWMFLEASEDTARMACRMLGYDYVSFSYRMYMGKDYEYRAVLREDHFSYTYTQGPSIPFIGVLNCKVK